MVGLPVFSVNDDFTIIFVILIPVPVTESRENSGDSYMLRDAERHLKVFEAKI